MKELNELPELTIAWQPIVYIDTGKLFGWEALVRTPVNQPRDLFRKAEENGKHLFLDLQILNRIAQGPHPPEGWLFVNLHPSTVAAIACGVFALRFPESIVDRVIWELPEDRGWPHDPQSAKILKRYLPGGRVALDDVGRGWADLLRLANLQPGYIKIAGDLVANIHQYRERMVVIEAIVRIAEQLGAEVIAEGVERRAEANILESLGIHLAQGFLFGSAKTIEALNSAQKNSLVKGASYHGGRVG